MYTLGFIGTGNMGGAMARAASKKLCGEQILLANRTAEKARALAKDLGCAAADNATVCRESQYIVLGVKPQMMPGLLNELAPILRSREDRFVLVTMAAGLTVARIRELAGGEYPVIRIMPNTPCAVGSGVVLCCRSENVSDADYAAFQDAFSEAGLILDISESLMDAGSAISGCGPAFVYMFIEAFSDAGVACGLPYADAQRLAAATVEGAAKMVQQSSEHPAQLRNRVCSPAGSTIEGVLCLENRGFRAAVSESVRASFERTKELGK